MLLAKAFVMREPPALLPRWPKVSIHDLHLNFTLLPVICHYGRKEKPDHLAFDTTKEQLLVSAVPGRESPWWG